MKRSVITGCFPVFVIIVFTMACARQGSPSGGPRDTIPPVVIRTNPVNGTVRFSSKTITISFNEFVVLDKIQEKFMMSPPVSKKPEIAVRGKNIVISFAEELKPNTTYALYFQDAIRDLNESNILENYQYVLSTGDYIDSLSVSGIVYDAFTLEVPQTMLVMLHSNLSDTAPATLTPEYISMTGSDGRFTLRNLREGDYRLYALADMNSNKKYEAGNESFAFMDEAITINTSNYHPPADQTDIRDSLSIGLLRPDFTLFSSLSPPQKYYLASAARRQARLLEYFMSMPLDTFNFSFSAAGLKSGDYIKIMNNRRDTIRIWLKDSIVYSNPVIETIVSYPQTSSDNSVGYVSDTISMRFVEPRLPRGITSRKSLGVRTNISKEIAPQYTIKLIANVPLTAYNNKLISIFADGDSLNTPLPFTTLFDSLSYTELLITHNLPEGSSYSFRVLPGALRSIYGETNDTISARFKIRPSDSYGSLSLNIHGYEGNIVVQLLNTREELVREQALRAPANTIFRFIENGKYRLKVVYDADASGSWTPGRFTAGKQPESVSFFPKELEIKSNWYLDQDWDISIQNQKDESLRLKPPKRK